MPVAQLADAVGRMAGQQELGVRIAQQADGAGVQAPLVGSRPADPVAELGEQPATASASSGWASLTSGTCTSILSDRVPGW